jgi:hypothetical protein
MAHTLTAEGGANLAPTAPHTLVAEGGASLAPTAPHTLVAEGGASLTPSAGHTLRAEGGASLSPTAPAQLRAEGTPAPAGAEKVIVVAGGVGWNIDGFYRASGVINGEPAWYPNGVVGYPRITYQTTSGGQWVHEIADEEIAFTAPRGSTDSPEEATGWEIYTPGYGPLPTYTASFIPPAGAQLQAEGGASLTPSAGPTLVAEGGASLAPTAPHTLAAEGGASVVSLPAPPQLTAESIY